MHLHLIGTIRINSRLSISGHPGMLSSYIFPCSAGDEYSIYADKNSGSGDAGYASFILITPDKNPEYSTGSSGFKYMTNGSHGGLMLCDHERLMAALDIDEIDEYNDEISYGLYSWDPVTFGDWKSNIIGANVIFIPSADGYFRVYPAEKPGKYIITCGNVWEEVEEWPRK